MHPPPPSLQCWRETRDRSIAGVITLQAILVFGWTISALWCVLIYTLLWVDQIPIPAMPTFPALLLKQPLSPIEAVEHFDIPILSVVVLPTNRGFKGSLRAITYTTPYKARSGANLTIPGS